MELEVMWRSVMLYRCVCSNSTQQVLCGALLPCHTPSCITASHQHVSSCSAAERRTHQHNLHMYVHACVLVCTVQSVRCGDPVCLLRSCSGRCCWTGISRLYRKTGCMC
jgi:hypothetical protein